jgi:hypothetical protein
MYLGTSKNGVTLKPDRPADSYRAQVGAGYSSRNLREWKNAATAESVGTNVPIRLTHHRDLRRDQVVTCNQPADLIQVTLVKMISMTCLFKDAIRDRELFITVIEPKGAMKALKSMHVRGDQI